MKIVQNLFAKNAKLKEGQQKTGEYMQYVRVYAAGKVELMKEIEKKLQAM